MDIIRQNQPMYLARQRRDETYTQGDGTIATPILWALNGDDQVIKAVIIGWEGRENITRCTLTSTGTHSLGFLELW